MKRHLLCLILLAGVKLANAQYNTFAYNQSLFGSARSTVASESSSVINIGADEFINFAFSSHYPTGSYHKIGKWYSNDIFALQYISIGADHIWDRAHLFKTTHSGNALVILASGNVLLGKDWQSNHSYKLDIAGKVRADEIVVNTTGADFVFEKNYKLRPLAEVEQFIQQNKHLPDITPAKKMQEEGVGLSELQTKLLQKIEELTLYIIKQQKEIEELKRKLN